MSTLNKTRDDIHKQEHMQHERVLDNRTLVLHDMSGRGSEVLFQVNWNSLVRRKGYIRISVDGKDAVIDRDQLWTILFMLGSAEEQEKLVSPFIKQTTVQKFFKMIGIQASRDVKKGEFLNVPLEFTFNPETNKVVIGKGNLGAIKKELLRKDRQITT